MKTLNNINFYLTKPIFDELNKEYKWAKRIHNLIRKPIYIKLFLPLLYSKGYTTGSYDLYSIVTPTPNGLDPLLTEEQVILLIQSSSLIGLDELTYLATALHQENMQNKL